MFYIVLYVLSVQILFTSTHSTFPCSDEDDEIVECDNCGISVHESKAY